VKFVPPQTVSEVAVHAAITSLFIPEHFEHGAQGAEPVIDHDTL
jgi:hypothetical protein